MKYVWGLLLTAVLISSCDNELIVTDEWKDIPVVWGLISKSDTAHYIRVEKAYLDPTTSALDIARIPDSLYYENAVVTLRRISTNQTFTLDRVDGDLEGYPREGGIFAETPNYLYKIKANLINLSIGEDYELKVVRNDNSDPVIAQTTILPKPVIRNPPVDGVLPFKTGSNYIFTWNPVNDAFIFDLHMRFHYKERSPATNNIYVNKHFDWVVARNILDTDASLEGSVFFNTIKANLDADPMTQRLFDSLDVTLWCAGEELYEFIKIAQANTGITSTQDIPGYTNLSEGIGIFSSRNVGQNTGLGLTTQAMDSLRNGIATRDLNFN